MGRKRARTTTEQTGGGSFAATLNRFIAKRSMTPGILSKLSKVPKGTIDNWLEGVVVKPQRWQGVVALAQALQLNESETNLLLTAAGHPDIRQLDMQPLMEADRDLLVPWLARAHYDTLRAAQSLMASRRPFSLPTTALVGREGELAALRSGLHDPFKRLITLVGPPGVGKTRIALHVADQMQAIGYEVLVIPLATIGSPDLVLPLFAQSIGLPSQGLAAILSVLPALITDRKMLCVFDNFEHVLAAAPLLSDLLIAAPNLALLATSRSPLSLPEEHLFELHVLESPVRTQTYDCEALGQMAAVQLFVDRARSVLQDFAITPSTVQLLTTICARLEGLPLAIELVVPRLKHRSLADIAGHLDALLDLAADAAPADGKATSLRSAIDGSYHLLSPAEQRLFARMAVFVGGAPQTAIVHVCNLPGDDRMLTLNDLKKVVESNLVQQIHRTNGTSYYVMLESIREYGLEKLGAEADAIRRRHAEYYLLFAEEAGQALVDNNLDYLDRLEQRLPNLRAALRWALDAPDPVIALRFCAALWRFWVEHSHLVEGFTATQRALKLAHATDGEQYAGALLAASELARTQGEIAYAHDLASRALECYTRLAMPAQMVQSLMAMIIADYEQEQYVAAQVLCERSLELAAPLNDPRLYAQALNFAALLYSVQGHFDQAQTHFLESQALYLKIKNVYGVAQVLNDRGLMAIFQYQFAEATALLESALRFCREVGGQWRLASTLSYLGFARLFCQDYQRAKSLSQECLALRRIQGDKTGIAYCFEALAGIAIGENDFLRAARLCGAAEALRDAITSRRAAAVAALYGMYRDIVLQNLGQNDFQLYYEEGVMLSLDKAIEYALQRSS